ncbi:TonB-dependent receptor plug domain-containing protein [Cognatilysobacter bugurensis]|uniref:TonB-dependent receptor n=1 Tax=Cognatilysobacter bugurensis TaxID=543356 RepID=A0A918SXV0_9GAMM|nr:TonB-dependent receptor [Lysobacter bugurensis]GHA77833.1 TonB-dependent receptor [Lysobacter bugurensis]
MTLKTTQLREAIKFALAVGATAAIGTTAVFAQDTAAAQTPQDATTLDRVQVTGSRIRAVNAETTAPVLTIGRAELENTGLTSVGDVLFNIAASDGGALRNITTSTNGSDGTQNISLRGLGATRTLVLVNGRRWLTQGDGTVDLNTIPIAVVERIEVLKDGASAIYGSDAIAGVINVITRTNFEGAEARAYMGQYAQGDGFQQAYDFTLGASTDRVNAVVSISYTDQEPVFAGDREISSVPVFGAGDIVSGGAFGSGFPLYGNFLRCQPGTRTTNPNTGFSACTTAGTGGATTLIPGRPGTAAGDFRPFVSFTTDNSGTSDRYNFAPQNYLLQPIERFNVYGQGTLRLTDTVNANVQATYVRRDSTQQLAQVPLSLNITGSQGPQWAFAPTAGNVFNPFDVDISSFGFRSDFAGPRRPSYVNDNSAVTAWLDGSFELAGRYMNWDVGASFLDSEFTQSGSGYINLFNLRRALGDSRRNPTTGALECLDAAGQVIRGCVPFNLFSGPDLGLAAGVISQAEYDAMVNYVTYRQVSTFQNSTNDYFANLAGEIVELPAGMLGFAVGVEHRATDYFNQPDALVAGGGSSDNFTEPTNGSIESDEVYAELNIPVLADIPFAQLLEVNLAARYSDYTASGLFNGATVTPEIGADTATKIGIKWQLNDQVLLRGTWSESFRAPSVTDLFAGGGESFPQALDPCASNAGRFAALNAEQQARCLASGVPAGGYNQLNTQIRSLVGGNPNLQPENGTTRTFGIVYSPSWITGLDFTLDYYNIRLENALSFRGSQSVLNECFRELNELFCGFVTRDATGNVLNLRQTQFNLDQGEVEGYDFTVQYRMPETAYGAFAFKWDNTYQTKNDLYGTVGEYNGAPTWRLRSNLSVDWQLGDFEANWTARYYSGLDEDCSGFAGLFEAGFTQMELCSNYDTTTFSALRDAENRIGATTYHDVQVGWQAPWNAKVMVGARNVFGHEPPRVINSFAHSFDGAYDLPEGAFYYMQYVQKF